MLTGMPTLCYELTHTAKNIPVLASLATPPRNWQHITNDIHEGQHNTGLSERGLLAMYSSCRQAKFQPKLKPL